MKSRPVVAPVALLGGVALNEGVTGAFREIFQLDAEQLFVPELHAWCGALGTALLEAAEPRKWSFREIHRLHQHSAEARTIDSTPLTLENCNLLRDRVPVYVPPAPGEPIPAYLGIRHRLRLHQPGGDGR